MAESGSEEKTEAPSQKKRDDARKEGQVAFSKELSSALLLGSFLLLFYFGADAMLRSFEEFFIFSFNNIESGEFDVALMAKLFKLFFKAASTLVLPFFMTAVIVGLFASIVQVGFKITGKPLVPKFDKLSPFQGLKRMFSKQALSELVKSLFKMGVMGYIGFYTFIEYEGIMANLIDQDPKALFSTTGEIIGVFAFRLFLALMFMAIFDYVFQRWDLEQKLKMSKQDLKEEMKQSEGDPHLKAKIKQVQQEMSAARNLQEVPKADVLITNPTHFAVAMLYDRETMIAPEIIAKGVDHNALRMIEIAKENNVMIYENPPVARGMYFQVEVGAGIPEEFYKSIAEILAFVYKSKKKKK